MAADQLRTIAPASRQDQLAPSLQPLRSEHFRGFAGIQQRQIFVAELDDVAKRGDRLDTLSQTDQVRLYVDTNVGVERDEPALAFPASQ